MAPAGNASEIVFNQHADVGTQPFGALTLLTRPPVLIPRPETEDWTIRLSRYVRPQPNKPVALLDLCTGSGCIALLLCKLWPPGTVRAWGIDVSQDAIDLAHENAKLCGMLPTVSDESSNASQGARNTFRPLLADMRDPAFVAKLRNAGLRPSFDIVTSNPPYIPRDEYDNLPTSVKDYEDVRALLGDPASRPGARDEGPSQSGRGLTFYHHIARLVAPHQGGLLAKDGVVAVEVGEGQAREVESIFQEESNLTRTAVWKDPWDIERVVVASR